MDAVSYLTDLKTKLLKADNWSEIKLNSEWISTFPSKAGVYVLRQEQEIAYVGETGNLKLRVKDLMDSRHHSIRRTIGSILFSQNEDFIHATNKRKHSDKYEVLLNQHISKNLKIAYLPIDLGRKELEELIEHDMNKDKKLNKRGKRKNK